MLCCFTSPFVQHGWCLILDEFPLWPDQDSDGDIIVIGPGKAPGLEDSRGHFDQGTLT